MGCKTLCSYFLKIIEISVLAIILCIVDKLYFKNFFSMEVTRFIMIYFQTCRCNIGVVYICNTLPLFNMFIVRLYNWVIFPEVIQSILECVDRWGQYHSLLKAIPIGMDSICKKVFFSLVLFYSYAFLALTDVHTDVQQNFALSNFGCSDL